MELKRPFWTHPIDHLTVGPALLRGYDGGSVNSVWYAMSRRPKAIVLPDGSSVMAMQAICRRFESRGWRAPPRAFRAGFQIPSHDGQVYAVVGVGALKICVIWPSHSERKPAHVEPARLLLDPLDLPEIIGFVTKGVVRRFTSIACEEGLAEDELEYLHQMCVGHWFFRRNRLMFTDPRAAVFARLYLAGS